MSIVSASIAWFRRHLGACFALMTLGFIGFGMLTLDLVRLLGSNAHLVLDHGWQGLQDGGLRQLLELLATTLAAMGAWLVFKVCETLLVQSLTR